MIKTISSMNDLAQIPESELKAAYALNMCTVSVSQIVDFNDIYILEQEYEAILNNLNLEEIPKDEALLRTLLEILNTITFFRIQDIKKKQIDKKYQQRVKNAIWSAVPNISMIVSGSPLTAVLGLATQIGTGYMNYRREKANALSEKEDAEIELQITAIEQLNALRRELFSAAWRLVDKHQFPDCLRLTEKQIKQYNRILMDNDEYRKYARFEAIQSNFYAYPPFWYNFAHTALYIASSTDDAIIKKDYLEKAHQHFEQYQKLNKFNLLREDEIAASADLEYVDLLMLDEEPKYDYICSIIDDAAKKAGAEYDVLQLCAIDYLRIGQSDAAAQLLKLLVNEDYNAIANAKILSRLYVTKYMASNDADAYSSYKILETRIDPLYLFPMPSAENKQVLQLEESFISKQKAILEKAYRRSLDSFSKKKIAEYNAVIPAACKAVERADDYFGHTIQAKEKRLADAKKALTSAQNTDYVMRIRERGFIYGYVDVLNSTVAGMETISVFRALPDHDDIIDQVEAKLRNKKKTMITLQEKLDNGTFDYDDFCKLVNECSYQCFTEKLFEKAKNHIAECVERVSDLKTLEQLESELSAFCSAHKLPAPEEYLHTYSGKIETNDEPNTIFFNYDLVGGANEQKDDSVLKSAMLEKIKGSISEIVANSEKISVSIAGDPEFESYLDNDDLRVYEGSVYGVRHRALAVIDDRTKRDYDLILCTDGIRPVYKNSIRDCVHYDKVTYSTFGTTQILKLGYPDEYRNKYVKIDILKRVISELESESAKQ